jgi:hypothetical protein
MLFDKIILVACKLLTFTTFKKKSYRKEIGWLKSTFMCHKTLSNIKYETAEGPKIGVGATVIYCLFLLLISTESGGPWLPWPPGFRRPC